MSGAEDESSVVDTTEVPSGTWSVARLNDEIESVLQAADGRFPEYVVGEISEVSQYDFATFFQFRDIEADAVISCLAWSHAVAGFDHDLEEGAAAVVRASVDFYPERGDTQLIVTDYWPVGDSDRAQALEELRAALEAEGLLADDRKQSLPPYPDCVGVVTSPSGSAREDFTTAVHDRQPGVMIKLCGATVQGDAAVPSIVGAIQTLERDPDVEVLVITRGGGADSDLWCFNEEPVVRSIADCTKPVVVAVGHEDDETLSEAVADRRAMTPTDAGVSTVPELAVVIEAIARVERRIESAYRGFVDERLDEFERRLDAAETALEQRAAAVQAKRQRAVDLEQRVTTAYGTLVEDSLTGIDQRLTTAMQNLEHRAETEAVTARAARGRVADLEARIDQAYETRIHQDIDALERRIDTAYRDIETQAKIDAGTAEARRLRIVVAALLALLVLGAAAIVLFVL